MEEYILRTIFKLSKIDQAFEKYFHIVRLKTQTQSFLLLNYFASTRSTKRLA
jgi:hypothetical protein